MLRKFTERWFGVRNREQAIYAKRRLALIYAFIGWNCFGVALYMFLKKRMPNDPMERRMSYSKLTGIPDNMHVYQISGLTMTNEFDIAYKAKVAQGEKEATETNKMAEN